MTAQPKRRPPRGWEPYQVVRYSPALTFDLAWRAFRVALLCRVTGHDLWYGTPSSLFAVCCRCRRQWKPPKEGG